MFLTPKKKFFKLIFVYYFKEKAIYKTNYSKDMRYMVANLATNSSFEITVDVMLRDQGLSSGNFIVRLVYKISTHSKNGSSETEEALETYIESDQINYVVYSISGIRASHELKFVRNLCLDACKGLKLKCTKCVKIIDELKDIDNDLKMDRLIVSVYYKIYQISLKGI